MCIPADRQSLFPGTEKLLHTIHRLGLDCAIVSNASVRSGQDYFDDFRRFWLAQYIQCCVSSFDAGIRKPDSRIFTIALQRLNRTPGEALVIGNSEVNDIAPGRAIGARTIRVAIEEPPPAAGDSVADAIATCVVEVADLVATWAGPPPPAR
jgi:FMN phosphatase YigB (HAD superfamily)